MASRMATHLEIPSIDTSREASKALMVEILVTDDRGQTIFVNNLPAAAMRHPADYVLIIRVAHNGVKLPRK